MEIVKICKKHGELSISETAMLNYGSRKPCMICIYCKRESGKKYRQENSAKEVKRKRNYRKELYEKEKVTKECKKHGVITPENQTRDHRCGFCKKEQDKQQKIRKKDYLKRRKELLYKIGCINKPRIMICHKHGEIRNEKIVQDGICYFCAYEKQRRYYINNREKVIKRTNKAQKIRQENTRHQRHMAAMQRKNDRIAASRAHWGPGIVKECRKHGLLSQEQTFRSAPKKGTNEKYLGCVACRRQAMKGTDHRRKQTRSAWNKRPEIRKLKAAYAKERIKNLADNYIKAIIRNKYKFKTHEIPKELIDIERVVVKIKRIRRSANANN